MNIKKQFDEEDYSDKGRIAELYEFYNEEIYKNSKENEEMMSKIFKVEKPFYNSLTDKQKNEFEKLAELYALNGSITDKRIFVFAFRLAVRLIFEGKY